MLGSRHTWGSDQLVAQLLQLGTGLVPLICDLFTGLVPVICDLLADLLLGLLDNLAVAQVQCFLLRRPVVLLFRDNQRVPVFDVVVLNSARLSLPDLLIPKIQDLLGCWHVRLHLLNLGLQSIDLGAYEFRPRPSVPVRVLAGLSILAET